MNRNKILIIIFALLLAAFLFKKFMGSDDNRNFRDIIVDVDTAAITKLVLLPKTNEHQPVILEKTGNNWKVSNGTIQDEADKNAVQGMLASLVRLTPTRLVSKSGEKWPQYEVNDSLGTQVRAFNGDRQLTDLIIGKFNFKQSSRSMSTFVRLAGEDEVYAVDGFLSSTFNQTFNSLRDKTFLQTEKANLTSLQFSYQGDSSFVLKKEKDEWQIDGVAADSAAVAKYISSINNVRPKEFVNDFDDKAKTATYQLEVDGNNMSPLYIQGYQDGDDIILHSSLNGDAYFKKGSINIFDQLFVSRDIFLTNNTE